MGMALFVTGGTPASIGPLLAVGAVRAFGLERTWLAAIPGVLVALFLLFFVRRVGTIRSRVATVRPRVSELRPALRPLTLLYFAVSRSAVSYGFMTFLPLQLTHHGYSVTQVGAIASLYLGCGAPGGFLGGWLAERWGGGRVVLASFLGSAPL